MRKSTESEAAPLRSELIDPVQDPRWERFAATAPGASIFHHPAWLGLLRRQYGYDISACAISDREGKLVAGLPFARIASRLTGRRLVALPFSDVCPPLGAAEEPEALGALADAVAGERARTRLPFELHGELPGLPGAFVEHRFFQHLLPLGPDVAAVEAGFSKSQVRRGIAKARREGVTVERRTDVPALDDFYELHLHTRRRQGVPTQPKRFIRRFAQLFERDLGFVLRARVEGRTAAAAVFLCFAGTLTYKYGASQPALLSMRPNNLLFREAIEWGCTHDCHTLDFGRTDLDNEGLGKFKRAWGAAERKLRYTFMADEPPAAGHGRRDAVVARVVQRSPAPVGRLIGEALYRHFG